MARSSGASPFTGHVRRRRPDGTIEDLGRLAGDKPTPDGMKIGADDRLFVTDIAAGGIRVPARDGKVETFIAVGKAPTNCAFDGETLWVTDRCADRQYRTIVCWPVVARSRPRRWPGSSSWLHQRSLSGPRRGRIHRGIGTRIVPLDPGLNRRCFP